jgi:hypothetical protein
VIQAGAWVFRIFCVAACAALLFGCAAAKVTPVRMSQPGDENLTCEALQQELAKNSAAAEDFVRRDKNVENANIAKNVGGAIPVVGILLVGSTDLSNKEQIQGRAILDRDERLTYLSKQKHCTN